VRVPEEAAAGNGTVILSFAAWKEGGIAPAAVELPLKGPEEK
jgi:hypothetical protein